MTMGERMTRYENYDREQLLDLIEDLQDRIVDLEEVAEQEDPTPFNDMWRDELTENLTTYLDWTQNPNESLSLEAQASIKVALLALLRTKLDES
tara:strand:+ start:719 stop:1000 length:282 start_codon:yes stop_codon:yes gene_type:complete